jgi:hypothetical protein
MSVVEQSVVVACGLERAHEAWQEFTYRSRALRDPQGRTGLGAKEAFTSEEHVTFEETEPGQTRVTLRAEYDPDVEGVRVSELRADVNDEIARFKEFAEQRMAA